MFHLIYISKASVMHSQQDTYTILKKSRQNNQALGITGILIMRQGHFMQLLEGDEAAVRQLYEKIAKDYRHTSSKVILEAHSADRIFPRWNMGLVQESHLGPKLNGLMPYFEERATILREFNSSVLNLE